MRIRKDKMITAIDQILADHSKREKTWESALEQWKKQRLADWKRDEWPKWKRLQQLIGERTRTKGPLTQEDLQAIFGGYARDSIDYKVFYPYEKISPPSSIELDGRKIYKPSGVNVEQMQAMKKLLDAIEDDCVTDTVLSRLGIKDVTPIFRAAVQIGGLVA